MGVKVTRVRNQGQQEVGYSFFCPGCNGYHLIHTRPWTKDWKTPPEPGPVWTFNGNLERPTFHPSLLVYEVLLDDGAVHRPRCHLFVREGQLVYCGDSGHDKSGETVDMLDVGTEPY